MLDIFEFNSYDSWWRYQIIFLKLWGEEAEDENFNGSWF